MLKKLQHIFEGVADDLGYFLKRGSTFILGKAGGEVGGLALAAGLAVTLGLIPGFEIPLNIVSAIGTTLAAGAVAGVSGALVQGDFNHRRGLLVDRYREEVGSILSKAPDQVGIEDLELIARGDFKRGIEANPAIRKELKNSWLDRNIGVILSAVVAAATFLIVKEFDPGHLHALAGHDGNLFGAIASNIGEAGFAGKLAAGLGINGLTGFATYHAIKTPLHMVSEKIFGIEENTVNEQITEVKRTLGHGHQVSPEQVLGVFIQAHQDVAAQLKAEYGKEYADMNHVERQKIHEVIQQYMDINSLTEDINKGRMRPEELAFISFGQQSGVGKKDDGTFKHRGNVIDGMWKGLSAITKGFSTTARPTSGPEMAAFVGDMPGTTSYSVHSPSPDSAHLQVENNFEEAGRKESFVARVGRKVENDGLSHVERLEQSTNQEVMLTSPAR